MILLRPRRILLAVPLLWALAAFACGSDGERVPVPLSVQALAGPICPVETDPPKPECADRPVAGAVIVIFDSTGEEVARFPTGEAGTFVVDLVPGDYLVEPQPVEGLMGTAPAEHVTLVDSPVSLVLRYDTGIR